MVLLEVFTKTWENILGPQLYEKEGIQVPHLSEQCSCSLISLLVYLTLFEHHLTRILRLFELNLYPRRKGNLV